MIPARIGRQYLGTDSDELPKRSGLSKAERSICKTAPSRASACNTHALRLDMPSVTSSFRMSKELQRELSDAAERTGKGKSAIIIEALMQYLHAIKRESLAGEARCQSELVSGNGTGHRLVRTGGSFGMEIKRGDVMRARRGTSCRPLKEWINATSVAGNGLIVHGGDRVQRAV